MPPKKEKVPHVDVDLKPRRSGITDIYDANEDSVHNTVTTLVDRRKISWNTGYVPFPKKNGGIQMVGHSWALELDPTNNLIFYDICGNNTLANVQYGKIMRPWFAQLHQLLAERLGAPVLMHSFRDINPVQHQRFYQLAIGAGISGGGCAQYVIAMLNERVH